MANEKTVLARVVSADARDLLLKGGGHEGQGDGRSGSASVLKFTEWLSSEEQRFFAGGVPVADECCILRRRLRHSLASVVCDHAVLGYFASFLANRNQLPLLMFWLESQLLLANVAPSTGLASAHCEPPSVDQLSTALVVAARHSPCVDGDALPPSSGSDSSGAAALCLRRLFSSGCQLPKQLQLLGDELKRRQQRLQLLGTAAEVVYDLLHSWCLSEFVHSDFYYWCQADALTNGPAEICDILFNNLALFYFIEYMEQSGLSAYMEFWLSSVNFREHWLDLSAGGQFDTQQLQTDAMVLYNKYFSLQAPCRLSFCDRVRVQLELEICSESGLYPDCFLAPCILLHNVLQQRYFLPFLKSAAFVKCSRDLVSSLRSSSRLSSTDHTDTLSTCSSEPGSLAGTASALHHVSDPSEQLYRRQCHGLSIGYVDHLGRYQSSLDPYPFQAASNRSRSHFTRVVRSLLKPGNSADEEVAWRTAQAFVQRVTVVTMGVSLPASPRSSRA